jgi:hypothetical protein
MRVQHITALVREHSWSVTELVHAIVILCTFHATASLAFAAGLVPEVDGGSGGGGGGGGGGGASFGGVANPSPVGNLRKRVDSDLLARVAAADDALQVRCGGTHSGSPGCGSE